MAMSIECDEAAPVPRETVLLLSCDREVAVDLFVPRCPYTRTFAHGGYAENVAAAKAQGWKESEHRGARIWLCPDHSGKGRKA